MCVFFVYLFVGCLLMKVGNRKPLNLGRKLEPLSVIPRNMDFQQL